MKLLDNKIKTIFLISLTVLLYFYLSIYIKYPLAGISHNVWKGYYILALSDEAPVKSIVDDLQKIGGWEVLSEYNSKVRIFNYTNSSILVPVNKLKDYYVKGDSLYDPFLKKLPLLFTGTTFTKKIHIVYIKSSMKPNTFSKKINTIMSTYHIDWFLPEIKMQQEITSFIIFSLVLTAFFIWHKELWPVLVSGIFPWVQFLSGTGTTGLAVAILFIFSLELIGSQLYRPFKHYLNLGILDTLDKKKLSISIFIFVVPFLYIFVNFKDIPAIVSFFMTVTAHLLAVLSYLLLLTFKRRLQQHKMFFPVKIKYHIHGLKRKDLYVFTFLSVLMLILPLIQQKDMFNNNVKLPVPVKIEGVNDFSTVSMEILNRHSINSELPNLSDYISHLMFLTTYPYGLKYSFPKSNTKITIPQFVKIGNRVLEKNVGIYMFTDSWYESIMDDSLSSDIVKLLLNQDSPTLVSYRSWTGVIFTGKNIRNHYWFSIIFLLVLGFWLSNVSALNLHMVKEFLLRRKQQVV